VIDRGPNHQTLAELSPPVRVCLAWIIGHKISQAGSLRLRAKQVRGPQLLGEKPVEGFDGGELVVLDIEDGVELGDVENVVDFLAQVQQL
jgi:hypothetical protein